MPDKITSETLLSNIMETLTDNIQKQTSDEDVSDVATCQLKRLFGRQRPMHHVLGGGKSADVMLWRNKKISSSVLGGATLVWILFEWLNYHLLTISCLLVFLGMLVQFGWSNASGLLKSSQAQVPRVQLPQELFVSLAASLCGQINKALDLLQEIACSGNLKQFLMVAGGLWIAAVIGSWCNFLTVIYIGFVGAHTLPVVYEKYEDEVDGFVDNVLNKLQHHYRNIPTQRFLARKRQ